MTDPTDVDAVHGRSADGHVPLPPEEPSAQQPQQSGELADDGVPADLTKDPDPDPAAGSGASGTSSSDPGEEWWRAPPADPLGAQGTEHGPADAPDGSGDAAGEAAAAAQEFSRQVQQAAGHISDAVAGVAYPAAKRRGLDIRWMRLSINIPAIVLALLATWGGRTATDRMVSTIARDGPFAPLGVVVLFAGVLLILVVFPVGTPLLSWLAGIVQGLARGLVAAVARGWRLPVVGYLMRLGLAWAGWAFAFGIVRVAGGVILHWLTGV